jgi:hypothetical protein
MKKNKRHREKSKDFPLRMMRYKHRNPRRRQGSKTQRSIKQTGFPEFHTQEEYSSQDPNNEEIFHEQMDEC